MPKSQDLASLRELPVTDLQVQLQECEEKLAKLKFVHAAAPIKNPLEIRSLRRQKARLITWIHQKSSGQVQAKAPAQPKVKAAAVEKSPRPRKPSPRKRASSDSKKDKEEK